jgi:hypothetical protein
LFKNTFFQKNESTHFFEKYACRRAPFSQNTDMMHHESLMDENDEIDENMEKIMFD